MSWRGANLEKSSREALNGSGEDGPGRSQKETVEAALNRLSKAYNSAMECVGAWYRAERSQLLKNVDEKTKADRVAALRQVGQTARRAFEDGVLKDPLVAVQYAPLLLRTLSEEQVLGKERSVSLRRKPVELSSRGHKNTVRKLAFLTLSNYADLLIAGSTTKNTDSILDSGLFQHLGTFSQCSCWVLDAPSEAGAMKENNIVVKSEPEIATVRLALTAYIDASEIDDSDPTTFLKLAAAARRLGRLLDSKNDPPSCAAPMSLLPYRRIERYALERAVSALPPSVPPNRIAVRALEQWWNEEEKCDLIEYERRFEEVVEGTKISHEKLSIPRYSWSVVGRMLLRAMKYPALRQSGAYIPKPYITLHLSPLLALPSRVLVGIIQYLEPAQICRFEATCRSLSASIVSARAILDHEAVRRETKSTQSQKEDVVGRSDDGSNFADGRTESSDIALPNEENEKGQSKTNRASKRLRSQLITSGKRSERESRRNSVSFCLLASTLGCETSDPEYQRLVSSEFDWSAALPASEALSTRSQDLEKSSSHTTQRKFSRKGYSTVCGTSSLLSFIDTWSKVPSRPELILLSFLAHVSLNVGDAYSFEAGGLNSLTTTLLECFDELNRHFDIANEALILSFSTYRETELSIRRIHVFAANLLEAELRFRSCDSEDIVDTDFDGASSTVSRLIRRLLESIPIIENLMDADKSWVSLPNGAWMKLKARCYWLLGVFYLHRGRLSHNVSESREAEREGISAIEQALRFLNLPEDFPVGTVQTPHLVSQSRRGQHWRELSVHSLAAFTNEIKASSILLQTQEQFLDVLSQIDIGKNDGLSQLHRESLSAIGDALFSRYTSSGDSDPANFRELIADFIGEHGETLLSKTYDDQSLEDGEDFLQWFDGVIPTAPVDSGAYLLSLQRPCILTILLCCLKTNQGTDFDVLQLLMNICIATTDHGEEIRGQLAEAREPNIESASDSESDDDSVGLDNSAIEEDVHLLRVRQYSVLLRMLLPKVVHLFKEMAHLEDQRQLLRDMFSLLVHRILRFISLWFQSMSFRRSRSGDWIEDLRLFSAVQECSEVFMTQYSNDTVFQNRFTQQFILGLSGIIRQQHLGLSDLLQTRIPRHKRGKRARIVQGRARLVAFLCCDLGLRLSEHPFHVVAYDVFPSSIFEASGSTRLVSHIAILCEALLWLWQFLKPVESSVNKSEMSLLDHMSVEYLRVPVGLAIVALCGSASSTQSLSDRVGLEEFYDSDCSALCLSDDEDSPEVHKIMKSRRNFLRVAAQIVHCIAQIFNAMEDAEAVDYTHVPRYRGAHGRPALPLVVSRVLNRLADQLLLSFGDKEQKNRLWGDYPFGTRTTGTLLDTLLCKAYKCLHGFALVSTSESKDSGGHSTSSPESSAAAAQLWRCILRAYSHGRKSPPKIALDTVMAALPPMEKTARSKKLHKYLFSVEDNVPMSGKGFSTFILRESNWDNIFTDIGDWIIGQDDHGNSEAEAESKNVRRGISNLIAQAAMPQYQDSGVECEQRPATAHYEAELSRKFSAIVECLCLGNANDHEATSLLWFKAAQCVDLKIELIADRLGLSMGFSRNKNFVPKSKGIVSESSLLKIDDLLDEQYHEKNLSKQSWIQYIGVDLSPYVDYSWSSFDSLLDCSKEIGLGYGYASPEKGPAEVRSNAFEAQVWREIEQLRQRDDLATWQQAWGGLFVSALRRVAFRCKVMALYVLYRGEQSGTSNALVPEIVESLGTSWYSELMGSQVYGYPMHRMTPFRKRKLSQSAFFCFDRTVDIFKQSGQDQFHPTWDLKLMMGKCHEKIAKTYWRERFREIASTPDHSFIRRYEHHMSLAFECYDASLTEAKKLEESNDLGVEKSGGSSHGSSEALYRLHASRLKCLIAAVERPEDERELAEKEGLRLAERHWHKRDSVKLISDELGIRDRVWDVLADVVAALAQCRIDHTFFHRSVYRHAQALMWAPILHDPYGDWSPGNLGTVPATKAFKLRGLNYSTAAASSSAAVMGSLFEKKRTQLCAVWVTSDSSDSVFETINNSVRKYDSLRGKYISAYVDTLRLCRRRNDLELFLKLCYQAKRDLPSYFAASASTVDGVPEQTHSQDCLLVSSRTLSSHYFLTTVKRQTNSALAFTVFQEAQDLPPNDSKKLEDLLKLSYACYLRLNCDVNDVFKGREWRSYRNGGNRDVANALTTVYLKLTADKAPSGRLSEWNLESRAASALRAGVQKCQELFPTLSGSFYSKKGQRGKPKQGKKRKLVPDESSLRSFEVTIPEGLSAGDKFLTSIQVGDKAKKIRLTVPQGATNVLRFSVQEKPAKSE